MKLTFLGTRGYIEASTPRHAMHTSLLVAYRGRRVMVDCGESWLGRVADVRAQAVVLTHTHPDHAGGLADGVECPVYATWEAWETVGESASNERHEIRPRKPRPILGITFEAFTLEHSLRAPAVGYRITAGRATVFYAPDAVYIHEREEALAGVRVYIGDGATLTRSMVRKRGERLVGHAPVRTQLTWRQKEGVPRAIITHCGTEIVAGDDRSIRARLAEMADKRGVEAQIAHDGWEVVLR